MEKYLRIREDRNGRTIEAWALVAESKPLLPVEKPKTETKIVPTFILTTSMIAWGVLGIYIGNLIFN